MCRLILASRIQITKFFFTIFIHFWVRYGTLAANGLILLISVVHVLTKIFRSQSKFVACADWVFVKPQFFSTFSRISYVFFSPSAIMSIWPILYRYHLFCSNLMCFLYNISTSTLHSLNTQDNHYNNEEWYVCIGNIIIVVIKFHWTSLVRVYCRYCNKSVCYPLYAYCVEHKQNISTKHPHTRLTGIAHTNYERT